MDSLDIMWGSPKNCSRGMQTVDELLHQTLKRSDTGLPRNTTSSGTVESGDVSMVEGERREGSCCARCCSGRV